MNIVAAASVLACVSGVSAPPEPRSASEGGAVSYRTAQVRDLDIFYREAGPKSAPTILLLHGFPTSSHMFRDLIPKLSDSYPVVAPDYPGFGQSSMPAREAFVYSFDNIAAVIDEFTQTIGLERFALYVQDYGAPVGFRIAAAHPERITGIIVQNGNAYTEGIDNDFWAPIKAYWADPTEKNRAALAPMLTLDATRWQYTVGARDPSNISPDTWTLDQRGLDRAGNKEIQLDLFHSYGSNVPLYPAWQKYFRTHQPPILIVWGARDPMFPPSGAEAYKRDITNLDFNLLDSGHFALEEDSPLIAAKIRAFMQRHAR